MEFFLLNYLIIGFFFLIFVSGLLLELLMFIGILLVCDIFSFRCIYFCLLFRYMFVSLEFFLLKLIIFLFMVR